MKTQSTLLGVMIAFGMLVLTTAIPQTAQAQCCAPPPPPCCTPPTPPCCTPPTPPCCAPPPPSPPEVCCDNVNRNNVHVNVSNVNVAVATASSRGGAGAGAGAGTQVFYGGGGGGGGYAPPMVSGVIQGLNVEAGGGRSGYQASRSSMSRVVIQAVCLDDRTIPHPASQTSPDKSIDDAFEGELYRCIAGTWLQATIAAYDGRVDFTGGRTLTCHKNDALFHGRGGRVECRPQLAARDCNERSLLRRFGAGIKILTMVVTETYTAYREESRQSSSSGAMALDGGVGGIVY